MSEQFPIDRLDELDELIGSILRGSDIQPAPAAPVAEYVQLARDLRLLPDPAFETRLRAAIERTISMSISAVQFRPGFRTVTPYLVVPEGGYLDFLANVFGAVETGRTYTSAASFHAEMRLDDSMLMIGSGPGRSMPAALHIYVRNADDVFKRALEAGAVELSPMMEEYGERFGCVRDPAGNELYIATHAGGNYIPENMRAVTPYFHPAGGARFIAFLKRAFNAEEVVRYDSPAGAVLHAKIRIGDSVVEVGDAHGPWQPMPSMIYLYVPNADALYEQAVRAGATSIHPPADQPYGDRSGGVQDEWGNQWYMATPM